MMLTSAMEKLIVNIHRKNTLVSSVVLFSLVSSVVLVRVWGLFTPMKTMVVSYVSSQRVFQLTFGGWNLLITFTRFECSFIFTRFECSCPAPRCAWIELAGGAFDPMIANSTLLVTAQPSREQPEFVVGASKYAGTSEYTRFECSLEFTCFECSFNFTRFECSLTLTRFECSLVVSHLTSCRIL